MDFNLYPKCLWWFARPTPSPPRASLCRLRLPDATTSTTSNSYQVGLTGCVTGKMERERGGGGEVKGLRVRGGEHKDRCLKCGGGMREGACKIACE